jgi:hypothetical protein
MNFLISIFLLVVILWYMAALIMPPAWTMFAALFSPLRLLILEQPWRNALACVVALVSLLIALAAIMNHRNTEFVVGTKKGLFMIVIIDFVCIIYLLYTVIIALTS